MRAPQYVKIRENVPIYRAIKAQLQATGYGYKWLRVHSRRGGVSGITVDSCQTSTQSWPKPTGRLRT